MTPRRTAIALAIGAASVGFHVVYHANHPTSHRPDYDQLHAAVRFVLAGRDPYALIGPGLAFENSWRIYYPLPGILVLAPLAALQVATARLVFLFVVTGCFGYALAAMRGTRWRYAILLSLPYIESVRIAQWSPLFFAMWTLPWLAVFAVVKPNAGAAVIEAKPTWTANISAAGSAALLTVIAFLVQPTWLSEWLALIRSSTYFSVPLLRPGGFLLTLALLRWRRPEARLLLFLCCIPVTPSYYENLLLFLVAFTGPEIMALVGLGYVMDALFVAGPYATWGELFAAQGRAAVWLLYLPALVMVLRRPNEGAVAAPVERMASRLPSWIRGQSQAPAA